MQSKKKIYMKIAIDYFVALCLLFLIIVVLPKLVVFFMPFVIGYIISIMANPIVKFLESKVKIVRKHSSALIIALVIFLLCFLIYWIISVLVDQAIGIYNAMPEKVEIVKTEFNQFLYKFQRLYDGMPKMARNYVDKIKTGFNNDGLAGGFVISISTASTAVKGIAEVLLSTIFSILSAYFFTADRDNIVKKINKYIPTAINEKLNMIYTYFTTAVGGYFKAQFKIMIILIAIMFVTFEIMDINYSFLISLGIGILDFLPVFGTGAVLWPWAAYEFIIGDYKKAIIFMVLYVVCQLVKQFLQPKVVGDSIGASPMLTLFLLFFGYKIGGLVGIIIALPAGLVLINLYRAGTFNTLIDDTKFLINEITKFCRDNNVSQEKEKEK